MRLGDSLDMKCANLAVAYERYVNQKDNKGYKDKLDHGLTTEQLQEKLNRVRGKDGNKS
jgi:hypothetical protein